MGNTRNPSLRWTDDQIEYTDEMIREFIKCSEDIVYFAETYCNIVSIDHGRQLIKLRDYQKRILKGFCDKDPVRKNAILLSGRQTGKCFSGDGLIRVRNKKTGEIMEVSVESFMEKHNSGLPKKENT